MQRLERRGSRAVSLTDSTAFAAMDSASIHAAFAYDPHSADEGFRLVGSVAEWQALRTALVAAREAQASLRPHLPDDERRLSEELVRERREDASRE